jgi:deoxyribonuclease-4
MNYLAFQIFASSPRTWAHTEVPDDIAKKYRELAKGKNSFAHLPYLCNPSTSEEALYAKSRQMLIDNMSNCRKLGVGNVVMHLGSHMGKGFGYAKGRVAALVSSALDSVDGVGVLLENAAGYKNCVGGQISEIGEIIDLIGSKRVGVCFDTCHAFAAGYELRDKESVSKAAGEIEEYIGKERMSLVHLNDAKADVGSGLDRHWHIGKGKIGIKGFTEIFSNDIFREGDFVMETPEDEVSNDVENMKELQKILKSCGLKANG